MCLNQFVLVDHVFQPEMFFVQQNIFLLIFWGGGGVGR